MGNSISVNKINFEDMQKIINDNDYILISTLPKDKQHCLILNTLNVDKEVSVFNDILKNGANNKNIVIYGENSSDNTVLTKYNQLLQLGFNQIYVYVGGLFEWLLLQDIYGKDIFLTTNYESDIIKYKGRPLLF
tara:strand:- start:8486 stop:8887 length:402 start_codon:yes stop_codon:yes gene_type:complete